MLLSHTLIVPHLPTMMIDDHRGHRSDMVAAMRDASERLIAEQPEVIVVLDARWETDGPFLLDAGRHHRTLTDYKGFGVEVRYDCPGHPELARDLAQAGGRGGVRLSTTIRGVDSGVAVPLHFLVPSRNRPVVPVSMARRTDEQCRACGALLRRQLDARPERIAFMVSGLLSANLHAWTLKRDLPEALAFDQRALEALGDGAWPRLDVEGAREREAVQPEAGLRYLQVLRGFLGADTPGTVHCYESSPGVGAALVEFPTQIAASEEARA